VNRESLAATWAFIGTDPAPAHLRSEAEIAVAVATTYRHDWEHSSFQLGLFLGWWSLGAIHSLHQSGRMGFRWLRLAEWSRCYSRRQWKRRPNLLRRNVNLPPAIALRGNYDNLLHAAGHLHAKHMTPPEVPVDDVVNFLCSAVEVLTHEWEMICPPCQRPPASKTSPASASRVTADEAVLFLVVLVKS